MFTRKSSTTIAAGLWRLRRRRRRTLAARSKAAANRASAEVIGKAIAERLRAKKKESRGFRSRWIHLSRKSESPGRRRARRRTRNFNSWHNNKQGRRQDRHTDKTPAARGDTTEKVVFINRCAKVVKGGRRFSFSALIVAGDHDGKVGVGFGKANEVAEAIRKASESARKSMEKVSLHENTIPHEVIGEFGGGRVLLRPASPGTGVIAGGGVRAVVEAAGIRDVLAKSLGSSNHANVVKATIEALRSLRRRDEIFKMRGIRRDRRQR